MIRTNYFKLSDSIYASWAGDQGYKDWLGSRTTGSGGHGGTNEINEQTLHDYLTEVLGEDSSSMGSDANAWFEAMTSKHRGGGNPPNNPGGGDGGRPPVGAPPKFDVQAGGLDFRDAAAVKAKMDAGWVPNAQELAAIKNAQEMQAHHEKQSAQALENSKRRRAEMQALGTMTDEEMGIGRHNDRNRALMAGGAALGSLLSGGRVDTSKIDFGKSSSRLRRESNAATAQAAIADAQQSHGKRLDELAAMNDKIAALAGEGRIADIARGDTHQQDVAGAQLTAAANQQQANLAAAQANAANNWQADMQKWQMAEGEAARRRAMQDMTDESFYQVLSFNGINPSSIADAKRIWTTLPDSRKTDMMTKAGQYLTSMNTGRGAFSQFMTNNVTPVTATLGSLLSFLKSSSEKHKEFKRPDSPKEKKPSYLERVLKKGE